jgi:hypothetical protein
MAELKVYGGNKFVRELGGRQVRIFTAARSRAEFARKTNLTVSYVRDFCCVTGNDVEVSLGLRFPDAVFAWPNNSTSPPVAINTEGK